MFVNTVNAFNDNFVFAGHRAQNATGLRKVRIISGNNCHQVILANLHLNSLPQVRPSISQGNHLDFITFTWEGI